MANHLQQNPEPVIPMDEQEMRELIELSTVEVLAQQLEAERQQRARVQVKELLVASALVGVTFGVSYGIMKYSRGVRFMDKRVSKVRKGIKK
jgi:hypothetical protein